MALIAAGFAIACGEDERPRVNPGAFGGGARTGVGLPEGTGATTATGGRGGTGEGGQNDPVSDPGAPDVAITYPEAVSEPADGEVLVTPEIDVTCRVREAAVAGSRDVDKSTIVIQMLDAEGEQIESVTAAPTGNANEYGAHFFLTQIEENGRIKFRCSASDTASPPRKAIHTVETFVDHGPSIVVGEPIPESAHPLFGEVRFEFDVEPAPLTDDDREADVEDVMLEVNGVDVNPGGPSGGSYQTSVDFSDQDLFPDLPNGSVPVIIRATNGRGAERSSVYSFVIDGEGPNITISSPKDEDVVGGEVVLKFKIEDALSGVDPDSVVIELNGIENHFGEGGTWDKTGDNYTFRFDSLQAEKDSKIQATINIRALDQVGNESDGQSLLVYLDNQSPLVALDPPNLREVSESGGITYCSMEFDPVGSLSANDLDVVYDVQRFRALVSDRTNEAPGQNILYYSGQDLDSVYLYLQPDPNEPVIVDTNGDGWCDEIVGGGNELPFQHLNPLSPQGSAWFGRSENDESPSTLPEACTYQNRDAPNTLCQPFGSDLTRVVRWDHGERIPMIFALGNLAQGAACTGTDWEIGQFLSPGWFCVAARAEDNVGNVGVSPPLRLCYDDGSGEDPDCSDPPSCTDGCKIQEEWGATLKAE